MPLSIKSACPFCFISYEHDHIYSCEALNERIKNIHPKKKTRRAQPLSPLTHEGEKGVGRPVLCNCERCIKLDEEV